jgi:hypothetical protein
MGRGKPEKLAPDVHYLLGTNLVAKLQALATALK